MPPRSPERVARRVDSWRLAAEGSTVSGAIPLSGMGRLGSLVGEQSGEARYELAFRLDERGRCRISGRVSARLLVRCQRCLGPMELPVECTVNIATVDGDEVDLEPGLEPVELDSGELEVMRAVEDELLLELPSAPTHPPQRCAAPRRVDEADPVGEVERRNPFATLAHLLDDDKRE